MENIYGCIACPFKSKNVDEAYIVIVGNLHSFDIFSESNSSKTFFCVLFILNVVLRHQIYTKNDTVTSKSKSHRVRCLFLYIISLYSHRHAKTK